MAGLGEGRMVGSNPSRQRWSRRATTPGRLLPADQFRIHRGAADRAVERRQLLPQRAEVKKLVDLAQQVIDWNPILKAKLIKKRRLTVALLPHHGRCPDLPPSSTESQPTPAFNRLLQQNPPIAGIRGTAMKP